MDAELKSLESKVNQIAQLCQRLRSENFQLRQELAASTNDKKYLAEKIDSAANHLEAVLAQLPEDPA